MLPTTRERQPIRIQVRRVLQGELGRLLGAVGAFELGDIAATLSSSAPTLPHVSAGLVCAGRAPRERNEDECSDQSAED